MGTIDLVTAPTGGAPLSTGDYNAQNNYLAALIAEKNKKTLHLTEWVASTTIPALKQGVYINHGGALFIVNSSDYVISGSPSDGLVYIKVYRSGDTLIAEFVNSITGYEWDYIFNGFYHSDGSQILPYVIIKSGSNYTKYTTDDYGRKYNLSSDTIIVGNNLQVKNNLEILLHIFLTPVFQDSFVIGPSGQSSIPEGLWQFATPIGVAPEIYIPTLGTWHGGAGAATKEQVAMLYSNGSNLRLNNYNVGSVTIYYHQF